MHSPWETIAGFETTKAYNKGWFTEGLMDKPLGLTFDSSVSLCLKKAAALSMK